MINRLTGEITLLRMIETGYEDVPAPLDGKQPPATSHAVPVSSVPPLFFFVDRNLQFAGIPAGNLAAPYVRTALALLAPYAGSRVPQILDCRSAGWRLRTISLAGYDDSKMIVFIETSRLDSALRRAMATDQLTSREAEVLRATAKGLTTREIAVTLSISNKTVSEHLANLFVKTGCRGRAKLVARLFVH
jgi:DNA-binding CsgD family transcriptional regulator